MNSDIAIKLTNVSKYYKLYQNPKDRLKEALSRSNKEYHKKFYATKGLSLEIKKGEILGIVGKNGSGKSTLLKLITGVLTPDEGSVEVNGKISALLELGSGFNPEFTGMQNIFFYGTIMGFSKKEMEDKLDDIIGFADIGEFIEQPIKTYSSGMKSRLGFAVAVHIDPEILILDEVLSVGDVLFQRKCYAKMEEFFNTGKTIIYVSHSSDSIVSLCSKAILLHNGEKIFDNSPKNVVDYYQKLLFSKKKDIIKKEQVNKINSKIIVNKDIDVNYFLSSLQAIPKFINKNLATFEDIKILSEQNKKVNILKIKNIYTVSFRVKFNLNLENITFGCQFKNIKGMVISGVNTDVSFNKSTLYNVKKNDIYNIKMTFKCLMLPEKYLLRIAVHNKDTIIVIEDSYIFKVEQERWSQSGISYMYQKFVITKQ